MTSTINTVDIKHRVSIIHNYQWTCPGCGTRYDYSAADKQRVLKCNTFGCETEVRIDRSNIDRYFQIGYYDKKGE